MTSELPNNISYQKLYEPEQNIWFLNWILKQHGSYSYLNQIILSSPFIMERHYWKNGQLMVLKMYKNEQIHCMYKRWYETGQFEVESYLKNKMQHGLSRGWHKNGQPIWEYNHQDGKKHGLSQEWYKDGQIATEILFQNDEKEGEERIWYENGQLACIRHWKNGKPNAVLEQRWHENGRFIFQRK